MTGTTVNTSKISTYALLQATDARASKLVNYIQVAQADARVSKLVNYILLAPLPSVGTISGTSDASAVGNVATSARTAVTFIETVGTNPTLSGNAAQTLVETIATNPATPAAGVMVFIELIASTTVYPYTGARPETLHNVQTIVEDMTPWLAQKATRRPFASIPATFFQMWVST